MLLKPIKIPCTGGEILPLISVFLNLVLYITALTVG